MKVTIGSRNSGKTTKAIKWLLDNPHGVLVTFSHQERARVFHIVKIKDKRITEDQVICWTDILKGTPGYVKYQDSHLYIDNLDLILPKLFTGWLVGCSFSETEERP